MSKSSKTLYATILGTFVGLVTGQAAPAATIIGQLTDPEQPEVAASVDILNASIEQDGGLLTFAIETRGEIPTSVPDNETLAYICPAGVPQRRS